MPIPRQKIVRSLSSSNAVILPPNPDILPPPRVLGVYGAFKGWRPRQEAAILTSIDAGTKVVIERMPTGSGKTLTYMTEAIMNGGRVVVLTSTKGQQDQIIEAFGENDIADVRGQINYRCEALMPGGEFEHLNPSGRWAPVAEGPCHEGASCRLKDGGCGYYDAIRKAKRSKIVIANYSFWLQNSIMEPRWRLFGDGASPDLLILDEAHEAHDEVCDFMAAELTTAHMKVIEKYGEMQAPRLDMEDVREWRGWALAVCSKLNDYLEGRGRDTDDKIKIKRTIRDIEKIARVGNGDWVVQQADTSIGIDHEPKYLVRFDPVWAKGYAPGWLVRGAKKVIMSSATVMMDDAELLGFDNEDITLFECPSNFPVERRRTYWIPCMQMNYKVERKYEEEGRIPPWIEMMGRIIRDGRMDRNGLIHTVSYRRRNQLKMWVDRIYPYLERMMVSHSGSSSSVRDAIQTLRSALRPESAASCPKILISPSVTTGYDFKYRLAEYQIIPKLPIPDTRVKVMKERIRQRPRYRDIVTAKKLMQMTGRLCREEDDQGETFITDDNIRWWLGKNERLMAEWWKEAYVNWGRTMQWARGKLPMAPERLID